MRGTLKHFERAARTQKADYVEPVEASDLKITAGFKNYYLVFLSF
jgi:hypothetical protein